VDQDLKESDKNIANAEEQNSSIKKEHEKGIALMNKKLAEVERIIEKITMDSILVIKLVKNSN